MRCFCFHTVILEGDIYDLEKYDEFIDKFYRDNPFMMKSELDEGMFFTRFNFNNNHVKERVYVINNDLDLDDSISYDTYENIDLQKALDELPEKYKTIVILRYFEDMKISEIAQVLDENTNTIKTRLYKALDKLKLKLRDDEE